MVGPARAAAHGVSVVVVGWLLVAPAAVTVLSRLGLGRLLLWFGRRALLVTCLSLGVAGFALLAFGTATHAIIAMVLLGVALGLPQPLTISWVVSRAPTSMRGAALGLRITSNRLLQFTLALVVGVGAGSTGTGGVFIGGAVLLAGAAGVAATAGSALGDRGDDKPP